MNTSYNHPSSLPNQAVDYVRKKNDKLAKETVDRLETIASHQLLENKKLNDYYKMFEGRLVWADYSGEDTQVIDNILSEFIVDSDNVKIPSFVKHYDILGVLTNQIVGEWLSSKDDFVIDCIGDPITDNEYLRERSRRIEEVVLENFQIEYKKYMAEVGFSEKGQFESEEEKQAYMQELEQLQAKIKPLEQVEKEMRSWKTQAVNWSNAVMQQDYFRFRLDDLDREETTDYVLTGRYFRNYFIGYDYYKPERWDPRLVFFSREESTEYPQDAEYVGIQYKLPVFKIKERFGHLLSAKEVKKLDDLYNYMTHTDKKVDLNSDRGLIKAAFGETSQVPFYDYFEYQEAVDAQELFGLPMGEDIIQTEDGEVRVPYYLDRNNGGLRFADPSIDRQDFTVRKDTVLVTEGYYKSMKKVWFAKYRDKDGVEMTDVFTAELLPEVIKDMGLKVDKKTSLEDIQKSGEFDTIYQVYVPEVRKFIKINANLGKEFEFYYDDVLPFQIKGDSNVFDVKLPVGGLISSNFIANKIRPYQIAYNICLNQIMNMMEKELGMFFLFDINLLPSEYKVYGDTDQSLLKLQEFIKDTGLAPIDTSKQNTQQNMSQANTFMYQDLSYTNHISARMQWAENYKRLALEQIGITPQRMGTPSEYETAEGIKQGVQASYAQTESLFSKLTSARLKATELHLAVAQYCQKEYIDVDFVYSTSDNNKAFIHLSDPDFPLRRIGVMPVNDSKKRSQRDMLVQTLMNLNTLGGDILDYAQLFTAKSTQEILELGRKSRQERLKEEQSQRDHEQQLLDKQLQMQAETKQADLAYEAEQARLEREKDIEVARISALGRAADKKSDTAGMAEINKQAELALKESEFEHKVDMDNRSISAQEQAEMEKNKILQKELELRERELANKERRESVDLMIAGMNKN